MEAYEQPSAYSWEKLSPTGESTTNVPQATKLGANENVQYGSQVDNPNDSAAQGIRAAQYGRNLVNPQGQDTIGSAAVGDLGSFAQGQEGYNATPESVYNKFNTTGVDTKGRRNLSRLVDLLNNRQWGTTRAAMGYNAEGGMVAPGSAGWKNLDFGPISTAESRAQQRAEGYEAQAAGAEISRSDWLKRLAPQLESLRDTLKTQFANQLDSTQVSAIDRAISMLYNEKQTEFTNREALRHLLNVSSVAVKMPGDAQRIFFNALFNMPQMNGLMIKATDQMNRIFQDAANNNGNVSKEDAANLQLLQKLMAFPQMNAALMSLERYGTLSDAAITALQAGKF